MKVFIFSFLFCFSLGPQARLVERIQAQIGEEMISLIDFKNFQTQLSLALVPPSLLLKQMDKKPRLLKNKKALLDFMITRNMLAQIAKKENLKEVPKKDVEQQLNRLRGSSSHKNFSNRLKQAGLSLKSLREQILIDRNIDLLLTQFVVSKIAVSEQDIESYHFNKYNQPLFKSFEYEFISVSFAEDKKPDVLKKLSDEGTDDLKNMARSLGLEYKSLKLKGKDIQKQLKKELDKLSVSQISPLLILGNSYYILQLQWKSPQISPREQKKKKQIEKILYEEKLTKEMKKWIEEKKAGFYISYHSP